MHGDFCPSGHTQSNTDVSHIHKTEKLSKDLDTIEQTKKKYQHV